MTLLAPEDAADAGRFGLQQLALASWEIADNWLPEPVLVALWQEMTALRQSGQLSVAGVGQGHARQLAPDIRTDLVFWHNPHRLSAAQAPLWQALDELRVQLNRRFFLGLKHFEGHYAVYPPGGRYQRHFDQFRSGGHRRVSFVLYLNPQWSPALGGSLRMFHPDLQDEMIADISPHWGRAVLFFSDSVPHEVTTMHADRFSFVGWFRDDDKPAED